MRELNNFEIDAVSGGFGLLAVPAAIGLAVSIPTIVVGATTLLVPVIGPLVMTAGIVGTSLSGAAMIASIVLPIL